MWSLRILNGPQAGQIFNLKNGKSTLGRASQCDIKIMVQGVSKVHCEILVTQDGIKVVDNNSSNGTYVNGTRIQSSMLRLGDKFSVHNVFLDVVPTPQLKANTELIRQQGVRQMPQNFIPQPHTSLAHQQASQHSSLQYQQPQLSVVRDSKPQKDAAKDFKEKLEDYINKVVLPGVYKLAQLFEMKLVLAGFVMVFIFAVTLFSLFPMVSVSKDSIRSEARKRAASLARALAETNRRGISENNFSTLSTFSIEREDGVKEALIISRMDGSVIAPTTKAGRTLDIPFLNEVQRSSRDIVKEIDATSIGASFPIEKYDIEKQEAVPVAFAVIIYDISILAMDDGIIVSLFMQNLIIATLFGSILFFFLYKLIEFPISSLNRQLDVALREKTDSIENTFLFPPLQSLAGNISSLLTRYLSGEGQSPSAQNRDFEASMLIQHFRDPAFAITQQGKLLNLNSNFESLAQNSLENLMSQGIDAIVDQSLKININDLIQDSMQMPNQIHQRELDLGRGAIIIRCHPVTSGNQPDYFLFSIIPKKEESA
ncbi:MAG: FHA domain-containing protein [Bdellovibrionaceae bacterium]|nr:FHA domain-containing protein [Pseudobdellovibrionaceae bacterium]